MEDNLITISAQYSRESRDQLLGTKDNEVEQNKIIRSITSILRNAKEIAIEKATINAGKE